MLRIDRVFRDDNRIYGKCNDDFIFDLHLILFIQDGNENRQEKNWVKNSKKEPPLLNGGLLFLRLGLGFDFMRIVVRTGLI